MDREYRKTLIERYLNAETEAAEERMLAAWFAAHGAEAEEKPIASILLAEHPDAFYDEAEKEFDAIIATRKRRSLIAKWALGAAASAALLAGVMLYVNRPVCDFNGLEIAQGIEQIMSLDMENVESVTARPKGENVVITAKMKDGSSCSYIMSKDEDTSSVSITAMND